MSMSLMALTCSYNDLIPNDVTYRKYGVERVLMNHDGCELHIGSDVRTPWPKG